MLHIHVYLIPDYHANHVHIDGSALKHLPEDGNLSQLTAITVESCATDDPVAIAPTTDSHATSDTSDPYNAHLPQSFVPIATQSVTEQEAASAAVSGTKAVQLIFICCYDVAFHWRNAYDGGYLTSAIFMALATCSMK